MNADLWQQIEALFSSVVDLSEAEREQTLAAASATLREAVMRLLAADQEQGAAILTALKAGERILTTQFVSRSFGTWRTVDTIGQGGMGSVFLARREDGAFKMDAALKVLHFGTDSPAARERFHRERQILASLSHPGIARLIDGGEAADGTSYIVLELVEGNNIVDYANANNLPQRARLELFLRVCEAVSYAHQNLVVHRDIKPSNIMVTNAGQAKLLDFGIAKLLESDHVRTVTALQAITPLYASPEQVRGDLAIGTTTDIYSLGVLLYELLTGRRPYEIPTLTPAEIFRVVCETPPAPGGLSSDLENILKMALRKEPERRYQSAREFADDIERSMANLPVRARPDSFGYRTAKFVRRHRTALAAGAFVGVALISAAVIGQYQARRAERRFQQVRQLSNKFLFDFDAAIAPLAGATKARELVVSTALEYLNGLAGDASGDITLQAELAAAYEKVGDAQGSPSEPSLGRTNDALASYLRSRQLWQAVTDTRPEDAKALRSYATVVQKAGDIQLRTGRPKEAADGFLVAAQLADRALARTPDDTDTMFSVGSAWFRRGDVGRSQVHVDAEATLAAYKQALDRFERAAAKENKPRYRSAISMSMSRIAQVYLESGRPQDAMAYWGRSVALRKQLVEENPTVVAYKRGLALDLMFLGDAFGAANVINTGDYVKAEEYLRQSVAIHDKLLAADRSNKTARFDILPPLLQLAEVVNRTRPAEALAICDRAYSAFAELDQAELLQAVKWQLVGVDHIRAEALMKLGRMDDALRLVQRVETAVRSGANDDSENVVNPLALASLHARILSRGKRQTEAVALLVNAIHKDETKPLEKRELISFIHLAETYQLLAEFDLPSRRCGWQAKERGLWLEWQRRRGPARYAESRLPALAACGK